MNGVDPPRGFAFAWFKIGNADIGVYSLHLKSNLITHGDKEAETAKNIRKREVAIDQLLTHIHDVVQTTMPTIKGVVIGGDFNSNHDQAMFATERTLDSLADAGYQNGFEGLAVSERVTHPGTHGFPDATFDFIFAKGPNGFTAHNYPDECIGSSARDTQFRFALTFAAATTRNVVGADASNALHLRLSGMLIELSSISSSDSFNLSSARLNKPQRLDLR